MPSPVPRNNRSSVHEVRPLPLEAWIINPVAAKDYFKKHIVTATRSAENISLDRVIYEMTSTKYPATQVRTIALCGVFARNLFHIASAHNGMATRDDLLLGFHHNQHPCSVPVTDSGTELELQGVHRVARAPDLAPLCGEWRLHKE